MGIGRGGGKKGGNISKRPPEDKIDIENHSGEGEEDDSSSETSLELNLDPQQLASVGLDRPLLKLRLMPQEKKSNSNCSWWGWNTTTNGRRNGNCAIA